jgi:hypothetical protein
MLSKQAKSRAGVDADLRIKNIAPQYIKNKNKNKNREQVNSVQKYFELVETLRLAPF